MSARHDIRDEPAESPASRWLYERYIALICERIPGFVPSARIFGSEEEFAGDDAAWVVAYDERGEPAGCGGLRALEPGVGEIKRMFVAGSSRGTGLGRRLLHELERRAAQRGCDRVRVMTTSVLTEAIAMYESGGYDLLRRVESPGEPTAIWMEKRVGPGGGYS